VTGHATEDVTEQATEQFTEQITKQVTEQVTEQVKEQVTEHVTVTDQATLLTPPATCARIGKQVEGGLALKNDHCSMLIPV